jgi:hypothetical protein
MMQHRSEWVWYICCAVLTIVWKCFVYCYIGVVRMRKPLKQCIREWFELVTIDSKVSWLATILFVWVIGSVYISGIGIDWLFGGVLAGIPVCNPIAGLLGVLAEYTAPAGIKWLASKIPFMNLNN